MRSTKYFGTLIAASVIALVVFSAFFAGVAGAAEWFVKNGFNSEGKELAGDRSLNQLGWGSIEIGPKEAKAKEEFVLRAMVIGVKVKLKATEVVESEDAIEQEGKGSGKLIFKSLSLVEPAGCTPPASITTNQLKFELVSVAGLNSKTALKFQPATGSVLTTFELKGSCGLAGKPIQLITTNGLFGETGKKGAYSVNQAVDFTPGINTTAGGNLLAGGNAAELTGNVEFMLTGPSNMSKEWAPE
jgi:hypothetical protein